MFVRDSNPTNLDSQITTAQKQLLATAIEANKVDLMRMSAGNISTRINDGLVAITPRGIKYNKMSFEDISLIDYSGNLIKGPAPSSETPMHTAIYRHFAHVGSVCHTHSTFAMTFAMLGVEIPLANLELLTCGAPIPVAAWACPGSSEAGEIMVEILANRPHLKVVLLRNHGLVAIGSDLEEAFENAFNAEFGLRAYHQALQIGNPEPISMEQLAEILARYSQQ